MRRKAYVTPESEKVKLFIENSFLTGSNEGGGGNEEYIPAEDLFNGLDEVEDILTL